MHWDIDKNLSDLLANDRTDPTITRVALDHVQCQAHDISLPKNTDVWPSCIRVWCISLGYNDQDRHNPDWHLVTYGVTIREAYLRARKAIKSLSPETLQACGLKGPKKHKFKKTPKRKDLK